MTIARLAAALAAVELPIILAAAPALMFPTPGRLLVLAVVPVLWAGAWVATGRPIPRTPFNVPAGLLLAMVGVSLFVTFDVRVSLGKVAGVVLGVVLFWAVSRWISTPVRLRIAIIVFVVAGATLAAIGLLGADYTRFDARFPGDPGKMPLFARVAKRMPQLIRGVPGAESGFNPNAVAGSLLLFIPLQVGVLVGGVTRWLLPAAAGRVRLVMAVGLQVMLLCLTLGAFATMQSRGAFLGLAVAGGAFLLWHGWRTRVLTVAVMLAAAVAAVAFDADSRIGRLVSPLGTGLTHTVDARLELWESGLAGVRDHPVTGMGMNTFRTWQPLRYPTPTPPYGEVPHAHNHLLQAALDLGIPGLAAYLWIWVVAARELRTAYRRAPTTPYAVLAGGLGAGLIASFVFGLADVIPLGAKVGVLFWLTLALVDGLRRGAAAPGAH